MTNVPLKKLNNSNEIPTLGLGTNPGFLFDLELSYQATKAAINYGYRLFDCSPIYLNEKEIGKAIQEQIEKGIVKREDLFIVTKFWITEHKLTSPTHSLKKSLENLQLTYVDLFLMTWPFSHDDIVEFTYPWNEMETLVDQKLTKSIGVCNFNLEQMKRLVNKAKIKPAVLQVECHINLNQKELRDYCKEEEIVFMGFTPFGDVNEARDGPYAGWKSEHQVTLDAPEMKTIAKRYKKSVYQVALRYLIQLGIVTIPKSCALMHLIENITVFDFQLKPEEMSIIDKLNKNKRILTAIQYQTHNHYPF